MYAYRATFRTLEIIVKLIKQSCKIIRYLGSGEILFQLQTDLRRQILGELISLYYATFLVSVRSLNVTEDIFSMEELFIEIEDYIM